MASLTAKGKRTKRQHQPATGTAPAAAAASSSSISDISNSSSTTATGEEEDMAHCLILLARGVRGNLDSNSPPPVETLDHQKQQINSGGGSVNTPEKVVVSTSRRFAETATTTDGKGGFIVYECKTCNKCFPSFQALGGHRASHKKPKLTSSLQQTPPLHPPAAVVEKKDSYYEDEESLQIGLNSTSRQLISYSSGKPKVHECSICGAEFSSGQALGGHMRRHRPLSSMHDSSSSSPSPQSATAAATVGVVEESSSKKEKNILSLDLNLPAPPEEGRNDFSRSPAIAAFPVSALVVDCHY